MNSITTLENLIYSGYKLHFPEEGRGYDMAYYPVFVFYYINMLRKDSPKIKSVFGNEFRVNVTRFRNTTCGDLENNRLFGKAGQLIPVLRNSVRTGEQLWVIFDEMSELFYTTDEFTKYLNENGISSSVGYKYHLDINMAAIRFQRIFSGFVRFLVDNDTQYLNIKSLDVVDSDDAFRSNNNDLREIIINITPLQVITIACIISQDHEKDDISGVLKQFEEDDCVSVQLLEEIHFNLTEKSRRIFESVIGLKFVLDTLLNEVD